MGASKFLAFVLLDHLLDQLVDLLPPVTCFATFVEVQQFPAKTTLGRGEFHRPQEIGCLFEAFANGENLVDEILDANDSLLA